MQVAKATMGDAAETAKAAIAAKDPQELLSLQAGLLQPAAEKVAAYSRHLYDIAASTNAELTKAMEAQLGDAQKKFMATVDTAVKNAPAGTENAVALVKSAMAAANNAYESVHKAAKQAADVAEANFQAMTNTAVKAAQAARRPPAAPRPEVEPAGLELSGPRALTGVVALPSPRPPWRPSPRYLSEMTLKVL
jgi:phasin family protein